MKGIIKMKPWVGQAIFAATVVGTVGAVGISTLVNIDKTDTETPVEIAERDTNTPINVEQEGVQEIKEEPVEPTESETPSPAASSGSAAATTPKPSTTQPATKPQTKPTPQPSTPTTPTYKYNNAIEFQRAYMGWCPQSVPADAYHHSLPKSVALGYLDIDYSSYKSVDDAAIYAWSWYQGARVNAKNDGSVFIDLYFHRMNETIIGDNGLAYVSFTISADPYTKTVTWRRSDGGDKNKLPQDVVDKMDAVALRIKNKMVQLDQQYIAKCGR